MAIADRADRADRADGEAARTSSNCRYEPASSSDVEAIHGLSVAVGWPHRPDDIEAAIATGRPWRAVDPDDGRLRGVAVWWPMEEAARIGLVIVAPDAQGRGIGRTLMERVIDDAGQRAMMLLATDAGRPLYASLGFESVGLNQRHLGEYRGEPTAADGVEPLTPGDVAAVLELDARAMGVVRRDIVEHLVEVGDGAVLRVDGHLAGYAIRRPFGGGDVVGPIVAPSDDEAVALFRAVARPGLVRVDRSVEAERLGAFLEDSGVTGHEVTHVMERGTWPQVDTSMRSHAMASHAWG